MCFFFADAAAADDDDDDDEWLLKSAKKQKQARQRIYFTLKVGNWETTSRYLCNRIKFRRQD